MVIFYRLDENYLSKKKQSLSTDSPDVFIAENYCDQAGILNSTKQSPKKKEDANLRENNDRVSY